MTPPSANLLAIVGSLRSGSFSLAVASSIAPLAPAASVTVQTLNDIPMYNADDDGPSSPASVIRLRQNIDASDALIVISPEYNYGIPGVLKNAIDWASRPAFAGALKGKPALIVTHSNAPTGGARAHAQIREALSAALGEVAVGRQITIAGVAGKIENGLLVDADTLGFIENAIVDLTGRIAQGKE